MTKEYKARKGARFDDEKAQVYGERIDYLSKQNGEKITPTQIVEDASKRNSPLHNFFEWNNTKAAIEWRLQQARDLVNHIVEVISVEGVQTEQKSFFSVYDESTKKPTYVNINTALKTPSYRKELLSNLIAVLENAAVLMKLLRSYEVK